MCGGGGGGGGGVHENHIMRSKIIRNFTTPYAAIICVSLLL
jgi:hypothetical protein